MVKREKNQTPSLRQRKVNSYLQQRISEIIKEDISASLTGLVTITAVEATPDLREAKVWFSVLGQDAEEVLKILSRRIYAIQGELYRGASMRIVPKIKFYIDDTNEFISHLNEVIRKTRDE